MLARIFVDTYAQKHATIMWKGKSIRMPEVILSKNEVVETRQVMYIKHT